MSSTKPSVILVNSADYGGGAETAARTLHTEYLNRGVPSKLVVGSVKGRVTESVVEVPNESSRRWVSRRLLGLSSQIARHGGRGWGAGNLGRLMRWLAEPVRDTRIRMGQEDFVFPGTSRVFQQVAREGDVLHLHNLHGGYFDLRYLEVLSSRHPTFVTLHDQWMLTGHCAYSLDCLRWKEGCGECPHLDTYPAMARDDTNANLRRKRSIYARSRIHVSAPSRWLLDQVPESILNGVSSEPRLIRYGVDQAVFSPGDQHVARHKLGIPQEAMVICSVANFGMSNAYKDWSTIENALRILGARSTRPVLVFAVGEAAPSVMSGTVTIEFIQRVQEPSSLAEWYRAADLFVHAANADNFPLTILEAQSCGTPVIATAVGGIPEQLVHLSGVKGGLKGGSRMSKGTAVLVRDHDETAMATATEAVLENQELLKTLGSNARRLATERFGLDRYVSETLRWYQDEIGREAPACDSNWVPGPPTNS